MSNSKFEYVKDFEIQNTCLKQSYIVIRVDGKNFTKFCEAHNMIKPNDIRGIRLMISSAIKVCEAFNEIFLAYGQSDEFSFVFRKEAKSHNRRSEKLLSLIVSIFTAAYNFNWNKYFNYSYDSENDYSIINTPQELLFPASFDGRIVLYPNDKVLVDYFAWRQVDCHINNLINTSFWCLVNGSKTIKKYNYKKELIDNDQTFTTNSVKILSKKEAHNILKGTYSKDKQELLYKNGINYNNISVVFKKGTFIYRIKECFSNKHDSNKQSNINSKLDNLNINKSNIKDDIILNENTTDFFYDKILKDKNNTFENLAYSSYKYNNLIISNEDSIEKNIFWEKLL